MSNNAFTQLTGKSRNVYNFSPVLWGGTTLSLQFYTPIFYFFIFPRYQL